MSVASGCATVPMIVISFIGAGDAHYYDYDGHYGSVKNPYYEVQCK